MSIQSSINNMLSLTGLAAALTQKKRDETKAAKTKEAEKKALRGEESLEETLRTPAEPKPTEAAESQAAEAGESRADLAEIRSSGLPYSRQKAKEFEQEFGMTRAELATATRQRLRKTIAERRQTAGTIEQMVWGARGGPVSFDPSITQSPDGRPAAVFDRDAGTITYPSEEDR